MAIDVQNIENYIETIAGSGWLLHLKSIKTMQKTKTAYLARPGFPGLIEVQEKEQLPIKPNFVESVSIPLESKLTNLIHAIGLEQIVKTTSGEVEFLMDGQSIKMRDLLF